MSRTPFLLWISIAALIALLTVSGCETMRGAGKDLQRAGDWMERQATR